MREATDSELDMGWLKAGPQCKARGLDVCVPVDAALSGRPGLRPEGTQVEGQQSTRLKILGPQRLCAQRCGKAVVGQGRLPGEGQEGHQQGVSTLDTRQATAGSQALAPKQGWPPEPTATVTLTTSSREARGPLPRRVREGFLQGQLLLPGLVVPPPIVPTSADPIKLSAPCGQDITGHFHSNSGPP